MASLSAISSQRLVRTGAVALAALALLALLGWLALPRIQAARAGSLLEEANNHIESANGSLQQLSFDLLAVDGFTSLDSITAAEESLSGSAALLEASAADIDRASEKVTAASGLLLLPGWYGDYLGKKQEIAGLRSQQLQILTEASTRLDELYGAAPLIFQSMEEMDRLLGQLEAAAAKTQSDPATASAELSQTAASMRAIQQQLDGLHQETDFQLLQQMSRNVAGNASLAEAAASLADAVASGDQARVQVAADTLEQQLLDTTVGVDYLDMWFRKKLRPLRKDYDELQEQQALLDAQAAGIYAENSGD